MGDSETLSRLRARLLEGHVIPAHPLALTAQRRLDERRQLALTRYYADAGAGGIAVGVHSTQFAIRAVGLFEPVLRLAAEGAAEAERRNRRPVLRIAGAVGPTRQAVAEAETARRFGYDAVLLSVAALRDESVPELVAHCRAVAEVLPLVGFYLQPAVGGRVLDEGFWRGFLEIEAVVAVKVAPFDRYKTLDVVLALAAARRERAHDVERLVAVERGDLDRDDRLDLEEAAPEALVEEAPADRRLEVEPDERQHLAHRAAVRDELRDPLVAERPEAQEDGLVAEAASGLGLGHRLLRGADGPRDPDERPPRAALGLRGDLRGEAEHRLEETGLPDRELRGVHADRDPPRAGVGVVAGEGDLAALVEPPLGRERERVGGDDVPVEQPRPQVLELLRIAHPSPRSGSACRGCGPRVPPTPPPSRGGARGEPRAGRGARRRATSRRGRRLPAFR